MEFHENETYLQINSKKNKNKIFIFGKFYIFAPENKV